MKSQKIKNYFRASLIMTLASFSILNAQQITVDYDSDFDLGVAGPQLLLNEDGDAVDWTRLWLKNSSDVANRWGLAAKPQTGEKDTDGILDSPIIFAYSGIQKFGVGNDGRIRVNKQFVLPNMDGTDGQIFMTDGAGAVNFEWLNYTQKESAFADPSLRIHNPLDASGHITFSNGGFVNNRFAIVADPSGTDAEMKFTWGNTTDPANAVDYLQFAFEGSEPYITTDERVGIGTIPYSGGSDGFKFHVVSSSAPAAHFGEQSSNSNGYVTVNKPASFGSNIMMKLRAGGLTKIDFQDDQAEFFVEALFREDVFINTANLDVGGNVTIDDLLIIEPRSILPTCAVGGANNGSVIYYENGATKKLRVCVDGSWENLN